MPRPISHSDNRLLRERGSRFPGSNWIGRTCGQKASHAIPSSVYGNSSSGDSGDEDVSSSDAKASLGGSVELLILRMRSASWPSQKISSSKGMLRSFIKGSFMPAEKLSVKGVFQKNAAGQSHNFAYNEKSAKEETRCFEFLTLSRQSRKLEISPLGLPSNYFSQAAQANVLAFRSDLACSLVQSIRYFCSAFDTKLILRLERFEPPTLRSESEGNAILTTHLGQVRHVPLRATGNKRHLRVYDVV